MYFDWATGRWVGAAEFQRARGTFVCLNKGQFIAIWYQRELLSQGKN